MLAGARKKVLLRGQSSDASSSLARFSVWIDGSSCERMIRSHHDDKFVFEQGLAGSGRTAAGGANRSENRGWTCWALTKISTKRASTT